MSSSVAPVCNRLRVMFDKVAVEPMPDQLNDLAALLDSALERGELSLRKAGQAQKRR